MSYLSFDIFPKKSRKQLKRETLENNRRRGKAAEDMFVFHHTLMGHEVVRTGKGHDFKVRERDFITGKVTKTYYSEIKSGNAKLSDLQQKTKRKKSNYRVERYDPFFF